MATPLKEAIDNAGIEVSGITMQKKESKDKLSALVLFISTQLQAFYRATADEGLKTGISPQSSSFATRMN